MSVDEIIAALPGLDCKRWRSTPGVDIYPPEDACPYRAIVWHRPEGFGWRVEIERRAAFYWEVESSTLVGSTDDVRRIVTETFDRGRAEWRAANEGAAAYAVARWLCGGAA